jgi:mannose-6-phosphate isomerase-like protein (cupin superfamily)
MPTFTPGQCPKHSIDGTEFTTLATPSHGNADVRVWQVEIQPGTPAVPHSLTRSEVFVVQSGQATVNIAGDETVVRVNDVLVVPAETLFHLRAEGDTPFRALVCFPIDGQAALPGKQPFTPPWGL